MAGSSLVLFMLLTVHWGAFVAVTATTSTQHKRITAKNGNMQPDTAQRQCGTHFNSMSDGRAGFMWPAFNSFQPFGELMWCVVRQPEQRHNSWLVVGFFASFFAAVPRHAFFPPTGPTAEASLYLWPYKKYHNYVFPFMRIEKLCTGLSKNVNNFTLLGRDTHTHTHTLLYGFLWSLD